MLVDKAKINKINLCYYKIRSHSLVGLKLETANSFTVN